MCAKLRQLAKILLTLLRTCAELGSTRCPVECAKSPRFLRQRNLNCSSACAGSFISSNISAINSRAGANGPGATALFSRLSSSSAADFICRSASSFLPSASAAHAPTVALGSVAVQSRTRSPLPLLPVAPPLNRARTTSRHPPCLQLALVFHSRCERIAPIAKRNPPVRYPARRVLPQHRIEPSVARLNWKECSSATARSNFYASASHDVAKCITPYFSPFPCWCSCAEQLAASLSRNIAVTLPLTVLFMSRFADQPANLRPGSVAKYPDRYPHESRFGV
jgi:hypothetical protein